MVQDRPIAEPKYEDFSIKTKKLNENINRKPT